MTNWPSFVK